VSDPTVDAAEEVGGETPLLLTVAGADEMPES
jgi:hypothetical protein